MVIMQLRLATNAPRLLVGQLIDWHREPLYRAVDDPETPQNVGRRHADRTGLPND
jgi:hypothetical protein